MNEEDFKNGTFNIDLLIFKITVNAILTRKVLL